MVKYKTNKARCQGCGDVIESLHGHDFRWCSCGSLAVDGGLFYLRRCFTEGMGWTELSEREDG